MYLYAVTAAFALAIGAGGAWQIQSWRHDAAEKNRIEQEARALVRRQENALDASIKYQAAQASRDAREAEVVKEVIRVVTKPVYREQCLDDDGMRILAADIQASNTRRGLEPVVPAASAPR